MAISSATITAKCGPGNTITAGAFSDVVSFTLDCVNQVLTLYRLSGVVSAFDISAQTTMTVTGLSTGLYVVTVS